MIETENNMSVRERYQGFPKGLSYYEFSNLDPQERKLVVLQNPILATDTYNRTMEHLIYPSWNREAIFALQMRRSPHGYLIAAGIEDTAREIADMTITQDALDFATEYFENTRGVKYFNRAKWQDIIDSHKGKIPLDIDAVEDGTAILPGDPVIRVKGDTELVSHFEPMFHRVFYPTLVATNAHAMANIIGEGRFIDVGLRGSIATEDHLKALKAMYTGANVTMTSYDGASGYYPFFTKIGTVGHWYMQSGVTEEEAAVNAIEKLDLSIILLDLNDTYSMIELVLKLKEKYRHTGKKIWARADSGDVSTQAM